MSAAAATLGTSVPRVARAIESLGIVPGRKAINGNHRPVRTLNPAQLDRLRQQLGSSRPSERFSREELFILSA
jgi:hypothetical protein